MNKWNAHFLPLPSPLGFLLQVTNTFLREFAFVFTCPILITFVAAAEDLLLATVRK